MRVHELMTEKVVTIGPGAPIKDVARLLVDNGISGLPVCDVRGRVLGVVSEGDILYKEHDPAEGHHRAPLGWVIEGTPNQRGCIKAKAATASEAMSSPAITIAPYESVAEAARMMSEHGVNRLPVVKDEQLVGIVTRADLVRAFVRSDAEIERELREDVLERTMWVDERSIDVVVRHGAVELTGRLYTRGDAELLNRLAARVPGVTSVTSTVQWQLDNTTRRGRRSLEHSVR